MIVMAWCPRDVVAAQVRTGGISSSPDGPSQRRRWRQQQAAAAAAAAAAASPSTSSLPLRPPSGPNQSQHSEPKKVSNIKQAFYF